MFSDDAMKEQAWLISRGVRPLAILEWIEREPAEMENAFVRLNQHAGVDHGIVPFVVPTNETSAAVGYARASWVVDVLTWVCRNAPPRQFHCIMGLLLGYSADEIADHDARECVGNPTNQSTSMSPLDCSKSME